MFALDGTFLLVFLSFLLFMFGMKMIFFDPIMTIKQERENTIDAGKSAAADAEAKRGKVSLEYQEKMAEARRNAQKVIQEMREQAKSKAGERVAATRKQALETMDAQLLQLQTARESVYQTLQSERDDLTKAIVAKLTEPETPVALQSTSSAMS